MPKYEYRCENCDENFEVTQSIKDDTLTNCPKCNKEIYRVISSNVGISFKGSGFHKNDYAKKPCANDSCANNSCPAKK